MLMFLLVLFCLSVDVFIGVVLSIQQIDKTTPMKTSTDEQNNINKNINRSTKQHQQIDKTTPIFLSVDGFIGVALSVC
jgi:hypothetical protein